MKETDDTPLTENESECQCCSCEHDWEALFAAWNRDRDDIRALQATLTSAIWRVRENELRVARLETQRTPEMENDDPEWYA